RRQSLRILFIGIACDGANGKSSVWIGQDRASKPTTLRTGGTDDSNDFLIGHVSLLYELRNCSGGLLLRLRAIALALRRPPLQWVTFPPVLYERSRLHLPGPSASFWQPCGPEASCRNRCSAS